MSDVTVSFPAAFRKRDGSALIARRASAAPVAPTKDSTPTARLLALAHFIERQVQAGAWKDYREAAARLGVSHARVSQISGLLMLPAAAQAEVLLGRRHLTEAALRPVSRSVLWEVRRRTTRHSAPR